MLIFIQITVSAEHLSGKSSSGTTSFSEPHHLNPKPHRQSPSLHTSSLSNNKMATGLTQAVPESKAQHQLSACEFPSVCPEHPSKHLHLPMPTSSALTDGTTAAASCQRLCCFLLPPNSIFNTSVIVPTMLGTIRGFPVPSWRSPSA